ncbi:hypothetical protein HaLaN_01321 [Haematococcus lacustris]|uniref:Uncharacterized protein n=1 Tax=Haematococcus lacustris TaxID=44745 RepID=A0A699YBG0_HAELA|nr:hypothetical protein HaLaN_01321 [Haematococcus lacustris]
MLCGSRHRCTWCQRRPSLATRQAATAAERWVLMRHCTTATRWWGGPGSQTSGQARRCWWGSASFHR